ncbi:MAG: ATP-binding protein [Cytophagaceae bacterium]|nr:ATP-binding protein [Cytophagaceae bacterium]
MRKLTYMMISFLIVCASCDSKKEENKETKDTVAVDSSTMKKKASVTLKWTTDTMLTTCESVLFDKERKILYVTNINGQPDQKDKNGFISKVSLDGKIENLQWVTGLNAPKGMGLYKNKLYVTDITALVEIDIEKGKVVKKYEVSGAKFLNDITVDTAGVVYFSDSFANKIHALKSGKVETWKEDGLNQPNGLLAINGKLYLASMGSNDLKVFDIASKKDSVLATGLGAGDGVVATGEEGYFIVSDWNGVVYHLGSAEKPRVILDTKEQKLNTADIEFIQDQNLLLVPTFFGNKIQAYEFTE